MGETAPYDSVMAIAQAFDDERANGTVRSGLHGIPMLFKVGALESVVATRSTYILV